MSSCSSAGSWLEAQGYNGGNTNKSRCNTGFIRWTSHNFLFRIANVEYSGESHSVSATVRWVT